MVFSRYESKVVYFFVFLLTFFISGGFLLSAPSQASSTTPDVDGSGVLGAGTANLIGVAEPDRVGAGEVLTIDSGLNGKGTVFGNLTVTGSEGSGFLTVFPCGSDVPPTSSVNFGANVTVANFLTTGTDDAGHICVYSSAPTHVVFDKTGSVESETPELSTFDPVRLKDTREDGGRVKAGEVLTIDSGLNGKGTVFGNLTVTGPEGSGYFTVFPCGEGRPQTSSLNFGPSTTVANFVVTATNGAGELCVFSTTDAHVVFDKTGSVESETPELSTFDPVRLKDTRDIPVVSTTVGLIRERYNSLGSQVWVLGEPLGLAKRVKGHEDTFKQLFAGGAIYASPIHGAHEVYGAIWGKYQSMGAESSTLGLPTSGEVDHFSPGRKNSFTGGMIYWDPRPGPYTPAPGVTVAVTPQYLPPTDPSYTVPVVNTAIGVGRYFLWWWKPENGVRYWTDMPRAIRAAGDGGPATEAVMSTATTIAADGRGGYYLADSSNHLIRHVNAEGIIHTVVGNGSLKPNPSCAYNRKALDVCLAAVHGITVDPRDGGLILTDTFNYVVTKVYPDGWVRLLAGSGQRCAPALTLAQCGENGPATSAKLEWPVNSRWTDQGLYIADTRNRVLLVGHDGILRRVVGTGEAGLSGDEGPATSAKIWAPADMIPYNGGLLVSDGNNCRVRWVDPQGIIHAFAGYGSDVTNCWNGYGNPSTSQVPFAPWGDQLSGDIGDGGLAVHARLTTTGFFALKGNDIYITDFLNNSVRRISGGVISTVVGTADPNVPETDAEVLGNQYKMRWTSGLVYEPVKDVFYVAGGSRVAQFKFS